MVKNAVILIAIILITASCIPLLVGAGVGVIDNKKPDVWIRGAPTTWGTGTARATLRCDDYRTPNCRTGTYKFNTSLTSPGAQCPQSESLYTIAGFLPMAVNNYMWICAAAKDDALNVNFSYPVEFRVDNYAPTVTGLVSKNPSGTYDAPDGKNGWYTSIGRPPICPPGPPLNRPPCLQMALSCNDIGIGCDSFVYCQDTTGTCTPNIVCRTNQPCRGFGFVQDGNHHVRVKANDTLGNMGQVQNIMVPLDRQAPTTHVDSRISDSFVPITGNTTDAVSKANQTEYKICQVSACGLWQHATMGSTVWDSTSSAFATFWSFNPTGLTMGLPYTFQVRSNDTAGNQEAATLGGNLIPDNVPPTVTVGFAPSTAQGKQITGIPQTGYWWSSAVTPTLYCHDQSPPCTMEWCHDAPGQAGCQPRTVPAAPNRTQLTQFSGEGLHYLRVNATDSAGNYMKVSPYIEPFGVDTVNPSTIITVTATDQSQNQFQIPPSYSAKGLDKVNISASSADTTSGIDRTVITYVEAGEARVFSQRTYTCTGGQPQCDFTYSFKATGLMYRVEVYDNAGNVNASPSTTGWHFLVDHPLANFVAHDAFVTMGTVDKGRVMVRNLQNQMENVTVWFEGYSLAWFEEGEGNYQISADGRKLNVTDLAQGEARTFSIGIMTSDPGTYELYMNATAWVSGVSDSDTMRITSAFPPEFPGLGLWAVMLLILAASAAYWKRI